MHEITHQKARALLQSAVDFALEPADKSALDAHLSECKECSDYASHMTSLESNLRRVMHANWDHQHPGLNIQAIIDPIPSKFVWNNFLNQAGILGKVAIMATLLLGYILVASLIGIQSPISNKETPTILPTPNGSALVFSNPPTPSGATQLTSTRLTTQTCDIFIYIVQATDSLSSIAVQHGISKELIIEYNNLGASEVSPGMKLAIPLCNNTPSRTASIPGNSLTITPINGTVLPSQTE